MKILIVIQRVLPVKTYGGTERVVWYLALELSKLGHNVSLLASKGTKCPFAKVIEIDKSIPIHKQIPDDVDIVHFNTDAFPITSKPYVITIHGNKPIFNPIENTIYVSQNHAQRFGSTQFVYNGLDWDDYSSLDLTMSREYHHFLGKAAWRVKNVRGAIRIINEIKGASLKVLGGYRINLKMGFRFTLSPKIDFCGMVGGERKIELMQRSKGLIFPCLWDEPFGLAITESLYCGAPVYGSMRGSLPELVTSEFGYLSNSEEELSVAIRDMEFSPTRCHQYALDCFNSRIMALEYIKKYETMLNRGSLI